MHRTIEVRQLSQSLHKLARVPVVAFCSFAGCRDGDGPCLHVYSGWLPPETKPHLPFYVTLPPHTYNHDRPFCNPDLKGGMPARVDDLISRLTLDEKPYLLVARESPLGNISRLGPSSNATMHTTLSPSLILKPPPSLSLSLSAARVVVLRQHMAHHYDSPLQHCQRGISMLALCTPILANGARKHLRCILLRCVLLPAIVERDLGSVD